ncbi:MAG TPA: SRPBCC family protein [Marmoricola sp.]|nr:SRPBCC family protein [Marmoricola sp.]HNJ79090.1 SRPBCC family protein [Marmoricola sp.]HNN47518.1 SRPBCC family protein [Marmoricola sp.]HNO40600.1 SRPBCC family protein [Marmoricola sp.]
MNAQVAPPLEESIEVTNSPAEVWALISDIRRMSKWSPQVVKSFVRGGVSRKGAKFLNINRDGIKIWPTQAMVIDFDPDQRLSWRIKENFTVWSLNLEPTESGGTRIIHRREVPQGTSDLSNNLVQKFFGGQENFTAVLRKGMGQTLQRIKNDLAN